MRHASLFSGIGGAEIAASWLGWENVFHVEINPFGQKVLEYWYPNSTSYEDITKTDFTPWRGRIDVLTAGFPCQPFSVAGQRKGADDDRYLWPQVVRAVREIRPAWVVGENVAGILTMVQPGEEVEVGSGSTLFDENHLYRTEQQYVLETVCQDLEREGYSVQPFVIPACAVGAPHRRDRVWIVAHRADAGAETMQCGREDRICASGIASIPGSQRCDNRCDNRGMRQVRDDRERHAEESKPERNERERRACKDGTTTTDTAGIGRAGRCAAGGRHDDNPPIGRDLLGTASGLVGERAAPDTKGTGIKGECKHRQRGEKSYGRNIEDDSYTTADRWRDFPTQSPVCSRDDGFPIPMDGITFSKWRQESIKAYGNAWCPPVAYEIFRAINEIENRNK